MTAPRGKTVIHAILGLIEAEGGVAISNEALARNLTNLDAFGEVDTFKVAKSIQNYLRNRDEATWPIEKVGVGTWRWVLPGNQPAGDDVEFAEPAPRAPSSKKRSANSRSTAVRGAYIVGLVQALFVEIEEYVAQVEADTADLRTKAAAYDRIVRQIEKGA